MKQQGLAILADITPDQEQRLRDVLKCINDDQVNNGLISFGSLNTVHYASWVILPKLTDKPKRLLLETNFDGELDAHLNDLLTHGAGALDAIYANCLGYPTGGASRSPLEMKQFLLDRRIPSSAYYIAFPGRSLGEIRNAIAVYEDAQRYINEELRRPHHYVDPGGHRQSNPSGFEKLTPAQVQDSLVHYFRSSSAMSYPAAAAPSGFLRLLLSWILAVGLIPEAILLIVLAWFCERSEAKTKEDPGTDLTEHPIDSETYLNLDRGLQNHLCTFTTVKRSRTRSFILKRVLSIVEFAARNIFVSGRLGQLSNIHFAKWMLIDGDATPGKRPDQRLLFVSNYDGSWASYLGDFSELASYGLNPIWSNTLGFLPTTALLFGGAEDIDRFKEGDKKHFYPAQIFYGAYPRYPTRNIKTYLDFSDNLSRSIAAAEKKERKLWGALEKLQRGKNRTVDRTDLQGLVASGYLHFHHARYLFLEIVDVMEAKKWLAGIVGEVSTAEHRKPLSPAPSGHLNIAFTCEGLKKLGLPATTLEEFPHEFLAGMSRTEAAHILGDTGVNAPGNWTFGKCHKHGHDPLHLMVLLFATSRADLDTRERELVKSGSTFREIDRIDADSTDRNEPFGFRDGISQPAVMSLMRTVPARIDEVLRPGEFVLGYENEHGQDCARSTRPASIRSRKSSATGSQEREPQVFRFEWHFLVARKLSQDVDKFWQFIEKEASPPHGAPDPERRELLAAKLMGRWRSGAPLLLTADRDVPVFGRAPFNNDFRYNQADRDGMTCPVGSHVRRANPRDDVKLWNPPRVQLLSTSAKSLMLSKRHRIIRRGRKYRELPEGATSERRSEMSGPGDIVHRDQH